MTINVGVIGCGYWGAKHARVLSELPGARLHSVVDVDSEKVRAITEKYDGVAGLNDVALLLANPEVDAVIIATPASSHYRLALQTLAAGKHTLVEKPLTTAAADAQHLIDLAAQKHLTLMVGHTFEYHPSVTALRQIVQNRELGDLYYVDMARLNLGLYQRDVNVVHDLSPHDISSLIYVLGERPVEVSARGYSMVHGGVVDVAYLEYRFASGLVANSRVSWLAPKKVREMTIVGSQKMVIYDDVAETDPIKVYEKHIQPPTETEAFNEWKFAYHYGPVAVAEVGAGEPLKNEIAHFAECIQTGATPRTDGANGRTVVTVLDAAQESLRNGGRPEPITYGTQPVLHMNYTSLAVGAIGRRAALAR